MVSSSARGAEPRATQQQHRSRIGALVIAVAACQSSAPSVEVAHRVVSLSPAITDLVVALGGADRLAGRTDWGAQYVPGVIDVPTVGDGLQPNVEAVVDRRPDVVLMYETPANRATVQQFARFGIPVREYAFDRLDDLIPAARNVGRLLGLNEAGDSVADELAQWIRMPLPQTRWRAAFVVEHQPLITLGAGSFLTEVARRAGAENVFAELSAPSPLVSLEAIVERAPDVLIVFGDSSRAAPFVDRPEWQAVAAVARRRIVYISGAGFSYPSVHVREAVRELRLALEAVP